MNIIDAIAASVAFDSTVLVAYEGDCVALMVDVFTTPGVRECEAEGDYSGVWGTTVYGDTFRLRLAV